MKAVTLSVLRIGRLYPPGNIPDIHLRYRLSRPHGHSATGGLCKLKIPMAPLGIEPATYHINPLKPELNTIYLLALLGAYHFLHVSRIRVKSLTFRLLMSYIYIYIYIYIYDISRLRVNKGLKVFEQTTVPVSLCPPPPVPRGPSWNRVQELSRHGPREIQSVPRSKHSVSVMEISQLMLYRETDQYKTHKHSVGRTQNL